MACVRSSRPGAGPCSCWFGPPAAGRITVDGVHLFVRDGVPTPLHETEYANDGGVAYASARLLDWAEERCNGLFRASDGAGSPPRCEPAAAAVSDALCGPGDRGRPTVFGPDAETKATRR